MALLSSLLTKIKGDDKGATAIEYCLVASLIAMAIIVVLPGIAPSIIVILEKIVSGLG